MSIRLIILGLAGLGLTIYMLLMGNDIKLFNPKGPIAGEQHILLVYTAILLLIVAVPTLLLLYSVAWKYRESNHKATYDPDARHGKLLIGSMWAVPTLFMLLMAFIMWPATHKLEPRRSIASDAQPLTIQVIAMRWKWIFIYPEQNIATVNYVQLPVGTPVQFELTADETPMSSFWIPHLGSQLYAMTGHVNRLNLMADESGDYPGRSAEINGEGFADMKFIARASTNEEFDAWVKDIKSKSGNLDTEEYKNLLKPSLNNQATYYSRIDSNLFDALLIKYNGTHMHQSLKQNTDKQ